MTGKKKWQEKMADFWMSAVVRRRWITLSVLLLLTLIAGLGLIQVEFDDSWENWLLDEDPVMQDTERFEKIFGEEQRNFVLVESEEGIFNPSTLEYLEEVTAALEEHLPLVAEVVALPNMPYMEIADDALRIRDLIPGAIPESAEELASLEKRVQDRPGIFGDMVTEDGKGTVIIVSLQEEIPEKVYLDVEGRFNHLDQGETMEEVVLAGDVYFEDRGGMVEFGDPLMLVPPALEAILKEHTSPGISPTMAGMAIAVYEREMVLTEEMSTLLGLALLASALLMFIIFRGLRPMLAAVLVMLMTIIFLFGAQGWLGIPLAMQSLIVMMLAMVIAVGYSIHFINHFLREFLETGNRREAIHQALREVSWPIMITAITTAMGFVASTVIPSASIRIVVLNCAAAAILTYFLVMTVVPLIFILGRDQKKLRSGSERNQAWQRFMVRWADLVVSRSRWVIVGSLILVLILSFGLTRINISTDTHAMIGEEMDFIRDANYVAQRLGFLYSYHVLVELPEEGMAKQAEVLQGLEEFEEELATYPGTTATASVNDLFREINMVMNENDPDYFRVPGEEEVIAQYLMLYEMSEGEGLENWVDFGYSKLNILVQLDSTTDETLNRVLEVGERGQGFFPEGTEVSPVGEIAMLSRSLSFLARGQINSIAVALAGITLIMMLILRSIRTGLISMIGNGLPVLAILGVMGLAGIPLDILPIMISPMVIGIAVDDTVHYFLHFKKEFERTGSYREANRETFRKIGKALSSTTAVLVLGFLILSLIDIQSFKYVGQMAALGIFAALFADLIIAPPLLLYFQPYGPEREKE